MVFPLNCCCTCLYRGGGGADECVPSFVSQYMSLSAGFDVCCDCSARKCDDIVRINWAFYGQAGWV